MHADGVVDLPGCQIPEKIDGGVLFRGGGGLCRGIALQRHLSVNETNELLYEAEQPLLAD